MFEGLGIFSSLIAVDNYLVHTTWSMLIVWLYVLEPFSLPLWCGWDTDLAL